MQIWIPCLNCSLAFLLLNIMTYCLSLSSRLNSRDTRIPTRLFANTAGDLLRSDSDQAPWRPFRASQAPNALRKPLHALINPVSARQPARLWFQVCIRLIRSPPRIYQTWSSPEAAFHHPKPNIGLPH